MRILVFLHVLTLLLLPLYIVRFNIFSIPFTLLELSLLISVSATFFYVIKQKIHLKQFKTFFDLPIFFFLLAALLSVLVTPDLNGGLGIFKAYFLEPMLFFYSLVFVGRKTNSFKFIFWGLIGAVILVSGLGLIQKLSGMFIFAEHEWNQDRISSFYNSANSVALFIGPLIPLIAVLFFSVLHGMKKSFFLFLLIFLSVIMFWTKSKGGMLAEIFSLGVILYGLLCFKFQKIKKLWVVVPVLFIVMSVAFFVQVYSLYNPMIVGNGARIEDDTLQIRYATWQSTVQILSNNLVLGTGLNGFKVTYDNYKLTNFEEDFQYPHTIVFNFWTETGLLGLVSFMTLLLYCFFICLQLNRKRMNYLSLGLIGAFSYIVIHGLVDVPYFKNDLAVQFWSLIAITQLLKDQVKARI